MKNRIKIKLEFLRGKCFATKIVRKKLFCVTGIKKYERLMKGDLIMDGVG
jgi:hypothetical protein